MQVMYLGGAENTCRGKWKWEKGTAAKKGKLANHTVGTWNLIPLRACWQTMNASEFLHVWGGGCGRWLPGVLFLALPVCLKEGMAAFSCFGKKLQAKSCRHWCVFWAHWRDIAQDMWVGTDTTWYRRKRWNSERKHQSYTGPTFFLMLQNLALL